MSDPSAKEMEGVERFRPSKTDINEWVAAEIERRMIAESYDKGIPFPKVKKDKMK